MTPRAPLLTATFLRLYNSDDPQQRQHLRDALDAIATGRTAVAPVLSEEQCRAEFETWFFAHTDKTPTRYECWLASRRAAGLVTRK